MTTVEDFLKALELERYLETFVENEIDEDILPSLTSEDLSDMGVTIIGHRRRLLNAIADLSRPSSVVHSQNDEHTKDHPANRQSVEAERRQLTIMFCDLVGSTAMSQTLDPEDMSRVIGDYHRKAVEVVNANNGHVAKFMGDGILVYFGYPQANEDDAERSVVAALALVAAVSSMTAPGIGNLSVRIGIATGLVVVGELIGTEEATERGVVGDTPNLAARLEALAKPNTVLVSPSTRSLVKGLFEFKDLGTYELKGISKRVAVSQALHETNIRNRFRARHGSNPLRLVGREQELETLNSCWTLALGGVAQVAYISGEAGIGKSHLTESLIELVEEKGGNSLRYFGSSHHQATPFLPVIQQLKREANFQQLDSPEVRLEKISQIPGCEGERTAQLFARLLSVDVGAYPEIDELDASELKREIIAALVGSLVFRSQSGPLLIVVEDAHWLDPSTLEFVDLLIQCLNDHRILLLINFRPEFSPPEIVSDINVTAVNLTRLQHSEAALVVQEVATSYALSDALVKEILTRTDGIPLFVEEMTRAIVESGHISIGDDTGEEGAGIPTLAIPTSLQDSLMARLDRLDTAKEIAQIGAVIGRTFSLEVLKHIAPISGELLEAALAELITKRLAFMHNSGGGPVYTFRHALLRDAAYESLLKSRRQAVHLMVAQSFVANFPGLLSSQPETIAYHYSEGDAPQEAIQYWMQAGEKSLRAAAPFEAVEHLKQALSASEELPQTDELKVTRVHAWTHLGAAYLMAKGQGAPEVKEAYSAAWEQCREGVLNEQSFPVLFGLWRYYLINADLGTAREAGLQLLDIARGANSPAMSVAAEMSMAITLFQACELEDAYKFAQTGYRIMIENPEIRSQNSVFLIGQDPEVACLSTMAMCDCLMGFGVNAYEGAERALQVANEQNHPFHICAAHFWISLIHMLRSNPARALESANSVIDVSKASGFPMWSALGQLLQAATSCQLEPSAIHIAQIKAALEGLNDLHIGRFLPLAHGLLADGYHRLGKTDEGIDALDNAFKALDAQGERWFEPELHRMRAVLLADAGKPSSEVVKAFEFAREFSRAKAHRLAELNVAIDRNNFFASGEQSPDEENDLISIRGWFENQNDTEMLSRLDAKPTGS